jgi:hypothetical protein
MLLWRSLVIILVCVRACVCGGVGGMELLRVYISFPCHIRFISCAGGVAMCFVTFVSGYYCSVQKFISDTCFFSPFVTIISLPTSAARSPSKTV